MAAFVFPQRLIRVGSAGWPVLKAAGDQEYSVIRLFAARSGRSFLFSTADTSSVNSINLLEIMRISHFLLIMFALMGGACSSDHYFKDQQAFSAYVSQLGVSNLSASAAVSRLSTEGFTCYPIKSSFTCVRNVGGLACDQKQMITFLSTNTNNSPLKVWADFGQVCL
jgi:hypothetical protein